MSHSGRSASGLDDIDGDDATDAAHAAASASSPAVDMPTSVASSNGAAAPPVSSRKRSRSRSPYRPIASGLDDIDDDPPAAASSAASRAAASDATATSASSGPTVFRAPSTAAKSPSDDEPALTPAAEVARVLAVLAADASLAAIATAPAEAAAAANGVAAAAPPPTRAAAPVADHFSVLGLPPPQVNAAGEGVWLVDDEDLKKAFKRLVLVLHPDKNPAPGAAAAFEAVKIAHNTLTGDGSRIDYVRAYVSFRESLAMRDASFLPRALGVGSGTLEETLAQGRALQALKAKQTAGIAAKLQAQTAAKIAAARAGEAARAKAEQTARADALKRKLVGGKPGAGAGQSARQRDSDSDSDDDAGPSVADKIRMAKGKQNKKIRML